MYTQINTFARENPKTLVNKGLKTLPSAFEPARNFNAVFRADPVQNLAGARVRVKVHTKNYLTHQKLGELIEFRNFKTRNAYRPDYKKCRPPLPVDFLLL